MISKMNWKPQLQGHGRIWHKPQSNQHLILVMNSFLNPNALQTKLKLKWVLFNKRIVEYKLESNWRSLTCMKKKSNWLKRFFQCSSAKAWRIALSKQHSW
jgi:hypothetical protein